MTLRILLTLAVLTMLTGGYFMRRTLAAEAIKDFEALEFAGEGDRALKYRLLKPTGVSFAKKTDERFPLLIFLHGAGERGNDNTKQLKWGRDFMLAAAKQHDAFVLVPQCPRGKRWMEVHWGEGDIALPEQPSEPMSLLLALLAELRKELPVDENRLYVMGLSMGGQGTWDMIQRNPRMFAAAVPVLRRGVIAARRNW
jgi:predicted peptidase